MREVIRLWPEGPPTTIDGVPSEVAEVATAGVAAGTTYLRNVSDPSLTVVEPTPGTSNGVGIVVAPGGGWTINMWEHEGLDVAAWLAGLGCTVFVLKYRLRATPADPERFAAIQAAMDGLHDAPIRHRDKPTSIGDLGASDSMRAARAACADDGRRAVEIVRREAGRLGVRPDAIGMIGFSAGAFLVVDVALDPRSEQVAFVAPIYGGETEGRPVPEDAPPLFTAVAQDDVLVRIVEGLHADWVAADRPAELHQFGRGGHGFGVVRQGLPSDVWTELFVAWLGDLQLPTGS